MHISHKYHHCHQLLLSNCSAHPIVLRSASHCLSFGGRTRRDIGHQTLQSPNVDIVSPSSLFQSFFRLHKYVMLLHSRMLFLPKHCHHLRLQYLKNLPRLPQLLIPLLQSCMKISWPQFCGLWSKFTRCLTPIGNSRYTQDMDFAWCQRFLLGPCNSSSCIPYMDTNDPACS